MLCLDFFHAENVIVMGSPFDITVFTQVTKDYHRVYTSKEWLFYLQELAFSFFSIGKRGTGREMCGGRRGWERQGEGGTYYDDTKALSKQALCVTMAYSPLPAPVRCSANSPTRMLFLHPTHTLKVPFPWLSVWESRNPQVISSFYINMLLNSRNY